MFNCLIFFISIIIRTKEKENFRLVLEIYKHGAISPKITQETESKIKNHNYNQFLSDHIECLNYIIFNLYLLIMH